MYKTIKSKLIFVFLCLLSMTAILGTVAVVNLFSLNHSVNSLMTNNYKSIKAVQKMNEIIERHDSAILMYLDGDRQNGINLFIENNQLFNKWYNIEANNITENGESSYVAKLEKEYTKYSGDFHKLQDIKNIKGKYVAFKYYNITMQPIFNKIKSILKKINEINETAMFRSKNKLTVSSQKSMYYVFGLSIIVLVLGFVISIFFMNKFLNPISNLIDTIKKVKNGDLNARANIISKDEIGMVSTEFNEMTEKIKLFEESTLGKLMAEKNKSLVIVKSISEPLMVLDNNYKIALLNRACEDFFRIKEESALNKHFLEVIRNSEVFDYITNVANQKESQDNQKLICIKSDNRRYYFNITVTIVTGKNKEIDYIVVLYQNVTELKELENLKSDFISTVSHEFKTPLMSLIMGTSLMMEENLGTLNKEQLEVMCAIKEDGEKLSDLVNNLFQISKVEYSNDIFKIEACSIREIIEASYRTFLKAAEEKGVKLYYEMEDNLPKVLGDFEKLVWVINNIIVNALKFTSEGDEVSIKAFVSQEKMCISVHDTGIGISEEYIDKIFIKFFSVDAYGNNKKGTGLGLSICKEIVEAHAGEIWCESQVGAGSTFTFTIPITK